MPPLPRDVRRAKQEEALVFYLQSMPVNEIARRVQVRDRTIYRWQERHDWKAKLLEVRRQTDEKLQQDAVQMREKHLKIVNTAIARWTKNLENPDWTVTTGELAQLLKHERDLVAPMEVILKQLNLHHNVLQQNLTLGVMNIHELISQARRKVWLQPEQDDDDDSEEEEDGQEIHISSPSPCNEDAEQEKNPPEGVERPQTEEALAEMIQTALEQQEGGGERA